MTSTRTNAFGSDGHLLFRQRSELDAFFAVEGMDVDKWGSYRPQDNILEINAALAAATPASQPFQMCLNPGPADPRVAHPPRPAT